MRGRNRHEGPSITLVVPTRRRPDTLAATLRSVSQQRYPALQILVSDNASGDATPEVVKAHGDARIRYLNPGEFLSMSDHWEFILKHVTGDYVLFIGDDDAVMPGGIKALGKLLARTGAEAVRWPHAQFPWPGASAPQAGRRIVVPLGGGMQWTDTRTLLRQVFDFEVPCNDLPCLYHGCVSMALIRRASIKGQFFYSAIPDYYSMVALSARCARHIVWRRPVTMAGMSHHSIGAKARRKAVGDEDYRELLGANPRVPFRADLGIIGSKALILTECLLQAQEHLGELRSVSIDWQKMVRFAISEFVHQAPEVRESVRRAILQFPAVRARINQEQRDQLQRFQPSPEMRNTLWLRPAVLQINLPFTVRSVDQAAKFAGFARLFIRPQLQSCWARSLPLRQQFAARWGSVRRRGTRRIRAAARRWMSSR